MSSPCCERCFLPVSCLAGGSPQFADLRPAALDVPLTSFHYEVKGLARDAVASAKSVGNIGDLRFMDEYFSFVTSRLNR